MASRVKLEKRESKSKRTKCDCCGEAIWTCEVYFQVVDADKGTPLKGEKYCKRCESYALANWESELVCEDDEAREVYDSEAGLRAREDYAAYQYAGCTHEYYRDRDAGHCN